MKKLLTLISMLFLTFPVFGASGSTGYFEITRIRAGGGLVRVSGVDLTDPSDCSGVGTNKTSNVLILETTASYKEMVSILLAARMARQTIQFWVNGCATDSGKSYPNAKHIYLQ